MWGGEGKSSKCELFSTDLQTMLQRWFQRIGKQTATHTGSNTPSLRTNEFVPEDLASDKKRLFLQMLLYTMFMFIPERTLQRH